jgi:hypothetical protein
MTAEELIKAHGYAEAISQLQHALASNPGDMDSVYKMAYALRAKGDYAEALPFFDRLATHHREDKIASTMTPGSAAWQIDIACLHWLSNDRSKATLLMHGLAAGILDGSVKYASDAAGGMNQGLLLYYMGVTANVPEEVSFAEDYLRNRVDYLKKVMRGSFGDIWPCRVAQYLLGEVGFETVMESVNSQPDSLLLTEAKAENGRRRRLSVALFHEGVRGRAQGHEDHCLARMVECYGLGYPIPSQEWYLGRYEVRRLPISTEPEDR